MAIDYNGAYFLLPQSSSSTGMTKDIQCDV